MKKTCRLVSLVLCLLLALGMTPVLAQESGKISPEPITYELMVSENPSQPWMENPVVLEEVFEKTNVRLKPIIVPQTDYSTKLSVLLSTNQMPDIVKTQTAAYNHIKTYAPSGIFLSLTDYKEYAPHYFTFYESNPNIAMYDFEGVTYGFALLKDKSDIASGPTLVMRYDLLEKNGIEMPANVEELLAAMQKLKEIYPDSQPWTCRFGTENLINRCAFILGSGNGMYYEPQVQKWVFGQATENFKEVLGYLNRAYETGALDTDYATMNNQMWQEKMNTGKSFMYFENPGFATGITANLKATDPDALLNMAPVPANNITGTARAYLYDSPEDAFYLLNADIKSPEIAVAFLDWCYSDEGMAICNFGKEGSTFEYDENGTPQLKSEYVQQFAGEASIFYAVQADLCAGQLGFAPRFVYDSFISSINNALGIEQDEATKHYNDLFRNDPAYLRSVIKPPFTEGENEMITDTLNPINTYLAAEYDKFIMGEKEIGQWDEVIAQLENMGIGKVVEIYNTAYDRALGK